MGHTLDVNENVYTRSSVKRRREAVNTLEQALGICLTDSKRTNEGGGSAEVVEKNGAGDRGRTGDVQLGKIEGRCKYNTYAFMAFIQTTLRPPSFNNFREIAA